MFDHHRAISRRPWRRPAAGFTLIELMIVMVIIGILMSFILSAAWDGVRRAEERATQALIAKLDAGVADRLEALLSERVDPTNGHQLLAAVYTPSSGATAQSNSRAQVIANIDYLRAEMPDVFSVGTGSANYPLNFAGAAFLPGQQGTYLEAAFTLPCDIYPGSTNKPNGYYGASIAARAALYKNVNPGGTSPLLATGYDMIDNTGEGLVDEAAEGGWNTAVGNNTQSVLTLFQNFHKHQTARAEVLYAILVEGKGPLGSVFSRDDFTDKEVQDTDNDGLPEFVDAWGQPLQFYRWPIMFSSDVQKGYQLPPGTTTTTVPPPPFGPYASVFEPREQNPLDPNQLLMAPRWWSNNYNNGPTGASSAPLSGGATVFQSLFHSLVEPNANSNGAGSGAVSPAFDWDRGSTNGMGARRAFYSKFLIASSGLDQELGVARLDVFQLPLSVPNLQLESQARQTDMNQDFTYFAPAASFATAPWTNPMTSNTLLQAGQDDITNHNYQAPGGVVEQ
jgi:prepilin-type N-terminal cleavage/methylation domain-containing protein